MGVLDIFKKKPRIDLISLQNDLRILNDCANLIEHTSTPSVFFERFNLYYEKLALLADAQQRKLIKVDGDNLVKKYSEMNTAKAKIEAINAFIDRYWCSTCEKADALKTEKGKINCFQKFIDTMKSYNNQIPNQCIEHYTYLYDNASHTFQKERSKIPSDQIDDMQRKEASKAYKNKVYKKYYSTYHEKPYISQDRELNTNWIDDTDNWFKMTGQALWIQPSMMTRYPDGLLPGHIYMLYWLNKHRNKRIPAYFEYKYGIDFCKEKEFLIRNGYLENDKPTSRGLKAIEDHYEIIEERHTTPAHRNDHSQPVPTLVSSNRIIPTGIPEGTNSVPREDKAIIDLEFENINKLVAFAIKLSGLRIRLNINTEELSYGEGKTYYDFHPRTPSGRPAKYPLTLHYKCGESHDIIPDRDRFGEIYYLDNGSIGSARLIFWNRKNGYIIHLGMVEKELSVKKVEINKDSKWVPLYKC